MKWQTVEELKQLLITLVQYESISGTAGEVALAKYMHDLLKDRSYFQKNPEYLKLHRIDHVKMAQEEHRI